MAALAKEQEDEEEMKHCGWPGVWLAHIHDMVPDFTCQAVLTICIVLHAMSSLCNDKGSGDDEVVVELLEAIPHVGVQCLVVSQHSLSLVL